MDYPPVMTLVFSSGEWAVATAFHLTIAVEHVIDVKEQAFRVVCFPAF
jgi:hypothetical protein